MSPLKDIDSVVGCRLRTRRTAMGLSQADLAAEIEIRPAQIDAYEQGEARIAADNLIRLSEVLGVRLSYFFQECESAWHLPPQSASTVASPGCRLSYGCH